MDVLLKEETSYTIHIMPVNYKPYEERVPDRQYHDLLIAIREYGKDKVPIHARLDENKGSGHETSRELTGYMLQYDLANGFPLLPIRNLRKPTLGVLGEILGFLNGGRTLEQLESYGMPKFFWEAWVTKEKCARFGLEEGDLGLGSYGQTLRQMPTPDGYFDQIVALERNMKAHPYLRTHVMSTWNAPYALGDMEQGFPRKVVVAPCHGNFVHFILFDEEKELQMTHTQRSADAPVGLQFNVIEWAAVGMMFAHILGYTFTTYTHFLSNPHIYDVQNESVNELLKREPRRLPSVTLEPDRNVEHVFDFKPEDFKIADDYDPHPWLKIPTPI